MRIKELKLFTNKLLNQREFFETTLGFDILDDDEKEFSVQMGYTKLTFHKSEINHLYHYCFLIPSNKLKASIDWLDQRLDIIEIENGRIVQKFESWNAESIYFWDGSGNLAEFIVRYDLDNSSTDNLFDPKQILCVNEIGMPTNNVTQINAQLEDEINSKFWKGNLDRFGTNGTQNGLFLLVNNEIKKNWFPTKLPTDSSPFEALIDVEFELYKISFYKGKFELLGNK